MENENNNANLPGAVQPPANVPATAQPQVLQPATVQPAATPIPPAPVQTPQSAPGPLDATGAATEQASAPNDGAMGAGAWQQIVEQQQQQINALMQQNSALNGQVVSLVQNGGQLNAAQPMQAQLMQQPANPIFQQPMPNNPTQIQQMQQLGAQPDPLATMNPPSLADSADYSLESLANEIGKPKNGEN